MKSDLSIILRERKNRKKRSSIPFNFFFDKYWDADSLLERINKKIKNKRLNQEARKQYIISLVTALEVYLKETFIRLINKKNLDVSKLSENIDRKFKFNEILFINKKNISVGELAASQFNFQNLNEIDKAFSNLWGIKFFIKLKNYKWYYGKHEKDFMQLTGEDYQYIKELLELRHNFTHDINFKDFIDIHKIKYLTNNLIVFIHMFESFNDEQLK